MKFGILVELFVKTGMDLVPGMVKTFGLLLPPKGSNASEIQNFYKEILEYLENPEVFQKTLGHSLLGVEAIIRQVRFWEDAQKRDSELER